MPVQNDDEAKIAGEQQSNNQDNKKANDDEINANTPDESLTGARIVGKWNLDISYNEKEQKEEKKDEKSEKTDKQQVEETDSTSKVYDRLGFDKNSSLDDAFEKIRQSFKEDDALIAETDKVVTSEDSSQDVLQQQIEEGLDKLKTKIEEPFERSVNDGLDKLKQKFGSRTETDEDQKDGSKEQDNEPKEFDDSSENTLPNQPVTEGQNLDKFDSAVSEVADQVKEAVKEAVKEVVKAVLDAVIPGLGQIAGDMVADKIADAAVEQVKDRANELKQNLTEAAEKNTANTVPTPAPSRAR